MREVIMEASDIRDLTVASLQQAVTKMMTFEWHKEIAKLPENERKDANLKLADCQEARLVLENAQLLEISDKLKQNEDSLKKGRDDLKRALEDLKKVKIVLNAVSSLLNIISKIVTL